MLATAEIVAFGDFRLDRHAGGLFRRDVHGTFVPVAIGSRALDVLAALVARSGDLVSKQEITDTVWPGVVVEESNLTVQLSALRRVLDAGRTDGSCIQTVPGRGYRFVLPVTEPTAPRLSIAVLPFVNLSGDPGEDSLADAITDDLTSDLSHITGSFVTARESANTFRGQRVDVRKLGKELGVRYVLRGSVRKLRDLLRVNAQLVATDTGGHLWSDRFDQPVRDLGADLEQVVQRIVTALWMAVIQIEAARSARERPNDPDAFDLVLRARSLQLQPPSPAQMAEILELYERALRLDPISVRALIGLVHVVIDNQDYNPGGRKDMLVRSAELLARARAIEPASEAVLQAQVHWLQRQDDRCVETIEAARRLAEAYPNLLNAYRWLGGCLTDVGRVDEALPVIEKAIRLGGPGIQFRSVDCRRMSLALAVLGRYDEAIVWGQRALAANPKAPPIWRAWYLRVMAEADALSGRLDDARRAMTEANRIWPYMTVRTITLGPRQGAPRARLDEGARLAGLRDHAEEDADFGVASDDSLRQDVAELTPTSSPGATTIRTGDLARLLAEHRPLVVDAMMNFAGRSIPGAVGLRYVGEGGCLSDRSQDLLRRKMQELTHGDLSQPIVSVGWNSERFDGRNLALRLAALGYTQIYWYRGGREAWEVNGLSESSLDVQEW